MQVPVTAWKYMIREWDGVLDVVEVLYVVNDTVAMQYDDGVIHKVSSEHFRNELKAVVVGLS